MSSRTCGCNDETGEKCLMHDIQDPKYMASPQQVDPPAPNPPEPVEESFNELLGEAESVFVPNEARDTRGSKVTFDYDTLKTALPKLINQSLLKLIGEPETKFDNLAADPSQWEVSMIARNNFRADLKLKIEGGA